MVIMCPMSDQELSPPKLIQDPQELAELVDRLNRVEYLAVDTESDSLHSYQEKVCLIQFSTKDEDALVDPLALDDLSPLGAIFADRDIEKILHAAEYDVMCLKRDFDFELNHLFDTYIAARTLGWDQPGLANVLERAFDIKLKKRFQRANWGRRPLPEEMLRYARLDTRYLLSLREHLAQKLKALDRWEEVQEAFRLQTEAPPHPDGFDPQGFWSIGDTRSLSGRVAAVLREVYLVRERAAESQDVPPFKIISNRALMAIARAQPSSLDQLARVKGVSNRRLERHGERLLEAVARGVEAPAPQRPRSPRVPDEIRDRYESLRTWRKETGLARSVDSDLILPKDYLWEIAHANPETKAELHRLMEPLSWRFEAYADQILEVLRRQ